MPPMGASGSVASTRTIPTGPDLYEIDTLRGSSRVSTSPAAKMALQAAIRGKRLLGHTSAMRSLQHEAEGFDKAGGLQGDVVPELLAYGTLNDVRSLH